MIRFIQTCLFLFLLAGCTAVSPWKLDSIIAGDPSFNSARLIYRDPASDSRLRLEFLRLGTAVDLFLNLTQYTITPSSSDSSLALVRFTIGDDPPFEEPIPLLEGRMRLRFPREMTSRITKALQEGKTVNIFVDGLEETVQPERFSKFYDKLTGSAFFQNPFKGPME